MRVCFVSRRFFPAVSGMSVYAANLLAELRALGHDCTLISQYREDAFGTGVYGGGPPPPVAGVRVVGRRAFGEESGGDFERDIDDLVTTIAAEHERRPFEVLHAQYGYPTGWATLLAAQQLGVPSVVSIQGGDGHWVGSCCETHRLAMVRVIDGANAVLIGCESFAAEVVARLVVSRERFTIVPGAVETRRFVPRTDRLLGSARTVPVVLYHGRIDRRKGALDLLAAGARLRDAGVAFRFVYSGIGPDVDAARERRAEYRLEEHVHFLGPAAYEDVPLVYREGDIFASPTYAEGFSNTILEAMASGLPVVAGRAVGVVDCIRDGENGLLHEPGDITQLTTALRRTIEDQALRARLAERALADCRATYSWTTVAAQIAGIYARVEPLRPHAVDPSLPLLPCRFRDQPHLL